MTARLRELDERLDGLPCSKQKRSLVRSLDAFLSENHSSGYCTKGGDLDTATPSDVVAFLIDRDARGKTQVHVLGCANFGKHGIFDCGCQRCLAAGTVDSYTGQLRAYYNSVGRTQPWRQGGSWENPCFSFRVGKYVKAVRLEQAEAHITPHQAVPIF